MREFSTKENQIESRIVDQKEEYDSTAIHVVLRDSSITQHKEVARAIDNEIEVLRYYQTDRHKGSNLTFRCFNRRLKNR